MLASTAIRAGDGDLFIAGGTESMSRAPYLNDHQRQGHKFGHIELRDSLQSDGLWCSLCDWSMGEAAEFIGRQLEITRADMDAFALRSHQLAAQATQDGKFRLKLAQTVNGSNGETAVTQDEPICRDTSPKSWRRCPRL
jgi:acetyl-CoA C-acetyltransferase